MMSFKAKVTALGKRIRQALSCSTVNTTDSIRSCLERKAAYLVGTKKPFRVVRAPIHQGQTKSKYAGIQCTSMAATGLMLGHLKELKTWGSKDMARWLLLGDKYHQILREKLLVSLDSDRRVGVDELPTMFPFLIGGKYYIAQREGEEIFGNLFETTLFELGDPSVPRDVPVEHPSLEQYLSTALLEDGSIILSIMEYSVAIKVSNNKIYLLDSHSRDARGRPVPGDEGTAILMKFKTIKDITDYLVNTYGPYLANEVQFSAVRLSFFETDVATIRDLTGAITKNTCKKNI